jgi:hypothetical protein
VAEERLRQQRRSVVVANLAYALVVADAGTATTSLVAGEPWDWGRFWWFFFLVLLSAVASSVASAVARRTMPEAQRKCAEDDEMTRAMRTGFLPPSADPQSWRRRIRRQGRGAAVIGSGLQLSVHHCSRAHGDGGPPEQRRRPRAVDAGGRGAALPCPARLGACPGPSPRTAPSGPPLNPTLPQSANALTSAVAVTLRRSQSAGWRVRSRRGGCGNSSGIPGHYRMRKGRTRPPGERAPARY